jgi:HD-like signal output (HDOD) protein
MIQSKLEQIMAQVRSFPSMPSAAVKLLVLFNDPDTTISQVEEILSTDPGLTANVLKLTNSGYFGLALKVGSVSQAIGLLGSKILIQLVLAWINRFPVMTCRRVSFGGTPLPYRLPPKVWSKN